MSIDVSYWVLISIAVQIAVDIQLLPARGKLDGYLQNRRPLVDFQQLGSCFIGIQGS
jgi:hypothetical protein